jgi:hypothetical protein
MFSTNVTGLIAMTQAVLPIFQSRPDGGRGDIINIGSIAGREPYQGGSIYCATKAAVRSFTDAMRKELIATRIRVIEIDPGQVETEFSVVRFGGDKEKAKKVYEGVEPLTPEDVAEVVVFAAGRRENVVLADTLVFPNHQVCMMERFDGDGCGTVLTLIDRRRRRSCTGRRHSDCRIQNGRSCRYWLSIGRTNDGSKRILTSSSALVFQLRLICPMAASRIMNECTYQIWSCVDEPRVSNVKTVC